MDSNQARRVDALRLSSLRRCARQGTYALEREQPARRPFDSLFFIDIPLPVRDAPEVPHLWPPVETHEDSQSLPLKRAERTPLQMLFNPLCSIVRAYGC